MKITPRKIAKAVAPYGVLVTYRKTRPRVSRIRAERKEQLVLTKKVNELLRDAKTIKKSMDPKVVVSLTSYGTRINRTAPVAVASLLRQTSTPDKLVLWLADGEKTSRQLKRLVKYGLDIQYCEDIKSYKKLIPALEKYPESIIITADDDVLYPRDWLSKMLKVHKKTPKAVLAQRARQITLKDDKLAPYWEWPLMKKGTKNGHIIMPNGIGGVLYPPHSLSRQVFDKNLFMSIAPHADDLWFWAMAELEGTRHELVENGYDDVVDRTLDDKGLYNTHNSGNNNDIQFTRILESFPELKENIGIISKRNIFPGSGTYWENRYAEGGNSGAGSYDNLAEFKAEVINKFVQKRGIKTVMEFGVGDGNQLLLANYPRYTGFDVSSTAIEMCKKLFKGDKTKKFYTLDKFKNQKAELTMSLDVLYHLVEMDVFEEHIQSLFRAATDFVIIYAFDGDDIQTADHVRNRKFTNYIESNITGWELDTHIPNKYPYDPENPHHTTWADFYIYKHI